MSILVPLLLLPLLTFLALPARQGHAATVVPPSTLLEESVELLGEVLKAKVSCEERNVTNIFVDNKEDDDLGLLCKASSITWESRSCHRYLEGICRNLLSLVRHKSGVHKMPCPPGTSSTTSLDHFLVDLRRVLQRLIKDQSLK